MPVIGKRSRVEAVKNDRHRYKTYKLLPFPQVERALKDAIAAENIRRDGAERVATVAGADLV